MQNKELNDQLLSLGEENIAQLYKSIFSTTEGKLVLQDLKNRSYFYSPTYHHEKNSDVGEGMRNIVLHIENQINLDPEDFKKEAEDEI